MPKQRVQLNVKLDSEESQALVEKLRQEAAAKGWTLRDALLDAVKLWLTNPPAAPPTPEGMLPEILNRLEALESSQPDITAITNAVFEQLQSGISTHMGRQDVDYLTKRINDLQQFTRQELAVRDKRLDAIRDVLSVIQAKISELQDGQAILASTLATNLDESKNTQANTQPTTHINTQEDTTVVSQPKKVSNQSNNKPSKGKGTHKNTPKATQKEKGVESMPKSLKCPHCGNQGKFNRRGHDKQGKQRWECGACKRSFISSGGATAAIPKNKNWEETATNFLNEVDWNG